MTLAKHKTKLVCTIGPASDSPAMLIKMINAGMNIARLNYSHGDFEQHKTVIGKLRAASLKTGKPITIMADLPGLKVRIGIFAAESVYLRKGEDFTLTTDDFLGDKSKVSVDLQDLPSNVNPRNLLYLNDGIIQLKVKAVNGNDILCKVISGGELRSHKGLNLPGIKLGISAFTERDGACMQSALENGVDAISQSFVESAQDVETVRAAAAEMGYQPFIIAKIERADALKNIDGIIKAADGIMIARGDLGVETRIERIAVVQKQVCFLANKYGKPVITATQMLESMTVNPRPTRAEATDVANAILDGTDCIMLSEESAIGKYPVEAVQMLAIIAQNTEPYRSVDHRCKTVFELDQKAGSIADIQSHNVQQTVDYLKPRALFVPTHRGSTPRLISRFKLSTWIVAVTSDESVCRNLQFSYGVYPILVDEHPQNWREFAIDWLFQHKINKGIVLITEGPSTINPLDSHSLQIIDLREIP